MASPPRHHPRHHRRDRHAGGTGYAIEYAGEAISALSMEGRMTVCNMSVEGGAKAGFIAPDDKVYAYLKDRPKAPKGKAWDEARRYWDTLRSDDGANFDREIRLDGGQPAAARDLGNEPGAGGRDNGPRSGAGRDRDENKRIAAEKPRLPIWAARREKITGIAIDRVFIWIMHQRAHRGSARPPRKSSTARQ